MTRLAGALLPGTVAAVAMRTTAHPQEPLPTTATIAKGGGALPVASSASRKPPPRSTGALTVPLLARSWASPETSDTRTLAEREPAGMVVGVTVIERSQAGGAARAPLGTPASTASPLASCRALSAIAALTTKPFLPTG